MIGPEKRVVKDLPLATGAVRVEWIFGLDGSRMLRARFGVFGLVQNDGLEFRYFNGGEEALTALIEEKVLALFRRARVEVLGAEE